MIDFFKDFAAFVSLGAFTIGSLHLDGPADQLVG